MWKGPKQTGTSIRNTISEVWLVSVITKMGKWRQNFSIRLRKSPKRPVLFFMIKVDHISEILDFSFLGDKRSANLRNVEFPLWNTVSTSPKRSTCVPKWRHNPPEKIFINLADYIFVKLSFIFLFALFFFFYTRRFPISTSERRKNMVIQGGVTVYVCQFSYFTDSYTTGAKKPSGITSGGKRPWPVLRRGTQLSHKGQSLPLTQTNVLSAEFRLN